MEVHEDWLLHAVRHFDPAPAGMSPYESAASSGSDGGAPRSSRRPARPCFRRTWVSCSSRCCVRSATEPVTSLVAPSPDSPARLGTSVELEVAVGEAVGAVAGVVDPVVMVAAEQDGVGRGRWVRRVPGVEVVGVAPGAGGLTAFGAAGLVADQECLALRGAEEPLRPAEVDREAVAVEDGGEDLRGAREPSGSGGGDPVAGEVVAGDEAAAEEVRGTELGPEGGEGDGDDDRGRVAAVDREAGGVEGFEERRTLRRGVGIGAAGSADRLRCTFVGVDGSVAVGAGVGERLEVGREAVGRVGRVGDVGGPSPWRRRV